MTVSDYYETLGLHAGSSVEEIKKAYRKKARLYHPDINNAPDAKDIFISITEAYEFLIVNFDKLKTDDQTYQQAMDDWRKYRQDRSRQRATVYARASYVTFKNSKFYKTSRAFDATTLIFSFIISIMVITYTIYGYNYRLKHPDPVLGKPSVFTFIMLLLLGLLFFVISFIYFRAFQETRKRNKSKL